MLGRLQARSSRVSGPVLQAPRPHGGGFPGSSLGAASYKTVPLVDEVPGYSSLRILRESGACLHTLLVWRDPNFLRRGVEMGVVCHRQMILTDASLSGWGAVFEGRPACGVWSGKYLTWHINSLELRVVLSTRRL